MVLWQAPCTLNKQMMGGFLLTDELDSAEEDAVAAAAEVAGDSTACRRWVGAHNMSEMF